MKDNEDTPKKSRNESSVSSQSASTLAETEISVSLSSFSSQYYADDVSDGSITSEERQHGGPEEDDPYADVREQLESLSLRDKLEHAHKDRPSSYEPEEADEHQEEHIVIPFFSAWTTYLGYAVLIFVGHVRDTVAKMFRIGRYFRRNNRTPFPSDDIKFYAPLLKSWENFYTRRLYHRMQDCFNKPIASNPGATINILERVSLDGNKTMSILGNLRDASPGVARDEYEHGQHFVSVDGRAARRCLNLGSYNYLGFADDWHSTCGTAVTASLDTLPVGMSSSRSEFGTTSLHKDLENIVSCFLCKEDAICLNMGFNTNATIIPALVGKGDLLISDELNHTSIVNGARASGASIRLFRHNDTQHLASVLREAIVMGRPRSRRPWNKIMVIVEGVYSMEGEYCDLRNVLRVCKEYGAYLYLDEAHSIGAMGPTGRGCCEYTGVDPREVDVLMGTFTKSFGGMGGYIASDKKVIAHLRKKCAGSSYHNSLSPVVCQQIISSFHVITGQDGTKIGEQKLTALRDNSNYFRMRLTEMGLQVLGRYDSPIMPVMLYNPSKIASFSRECMKRGLAVVVVGFPAVPILMSRARFCISAGHTREGLDRALKEIDEIADILKLRYDRSILG